MYTMKQQYKPAVQRNATIYNSANTIYGAIGWVVVQHTISLGNALRVSKDSLQVAVTKPVRVQIFVDGLAFHSLEFSVWS